MRIYISVDMEGVAGIVRRHQVLRGESGYDEACRLMTGEANAAALGAFDAGRSNKDELIDALARSKRASYEAILGALGRDELKEICRAAGLSDKGKQKAELVGRILGREVGGEAEAVERSPVVGGNGKSQRRGKGRTKDKVESAGKVGRDDGGEGADRKVTPQGNRLSELRAKFGGAIVYELIRSNRLTEAPLSDRALECAEEMLRWEPSIPHPFHGILPTAKRLDDRQLLSDNLPQEIRDLTSDLFQKSLSEEGNDDVLAALLKLAARAYPALLSWSSLEQLQKY